MRMIDLRPQYTIPLGFRGALLLFPAVGQKNPYIELAIFHPDLPVQAFEVCAERRRLLLPNGNSTIEMGFVPPVFGEEYAVEMSAPEFVRLHLVEQQRYGRGVGKICFSSLANGSPQFFSKATFYFGIPVVPSMFHRSNDWIHGL